MPSNWEQFKEELTFDQFNTLAAYDDCSICPARFFCTRDRSDPDFYEYCEDTVRAWMNKEYKAPLEG